MLQLEKNKKRKRDPAFIPLEKLTLVDIIEKYANVIECKKTDAVSNRAKADKWIEIGREFNAITSYIERDVSTLKNLWENLKKKAKATLTAANKSVNGTGCVSLKGSRDNPVINRVFSLVKSDVEGLNKSVDSDYQGGGSLKDSKDYPIINRACSLITTNKEAGFNKSLDPDAQDGFVECTTVKDYANEDYEGFKPPPLQVPENEETFTKTDLTVPVQSSGHVGIKRRHVIKKRNTLLLTKTKINGLKLTMHQAQIEHEVTLRIMKLQEAQEIEKLKQEGIRTQILREQLKQIKNT